MKLTQDVKGENNFLLQKNYVHVMTLIYPLYNCCEGFSGD